MALAGGSVDDAAAVELDMEGGVSRRGSTVPESEDDEVWFVAGSAAEGVAASTVSEAGETCEGSVVVGEEVGHVEASASS